MSHTNNEQAAPISLKAKIVLVVHRDGSEAIIRTKATEHTPAASVILYQVVGGPHDGQRGSWPELHDRVGRENIEHHDHYEAVDFTTGEPIPSKRPSSTKRKSIRPALRISEEDYEILKRFIKAQNDEDKAFCERHGFTHKPFDRDVLIGTLLHMALRQWDIDQQAIEAAQTPAAPTPTTPDALDELRQVAPFGTPPPSWLDEIQVEGA